MKKQQHKTRQTFLDRAITWLSPERGRRRYQERVILDFIKRRDYSAGDRGRRTDGWNLRTGQGPNAAFKRSLPLIRERSRDIVRNNPWGASMRSEIVANLIHYGIIASFTNHSAVGKEMDEDVPDIWLRWAETFQCDAAGRKNFYDIQKLVAGTWFESGECFIRRVWRDDWKPGEIPFALQVLEPEFLDHSHDGRDNTKLGIKFDANGRRLGYWVFKNHPGEAVQNESFFVDAADMIHVFSEDRPGQIRGVPLMAPVILRMYNLDLFEDAELTKQEVAAMFAAFEKDADPTMRQYSEEEEDGKNGLAVDDIQPGAIQRLGPGRDVVFSNPPQRSGYAEYVKQNLMAVAAGVGLTYENMSGDYGRVTFLNGRMGQLRFYRKIDQWLWMMFIPQFCDGAARWFREGAAIAGRDMSGFAIEWQPPVKQMVDPATEAKAEEHLVRMGAKTQYEVIRGQGHDPKRFLKQRKHEQETMDEMGLVFTTDVRKVSGAGQLQLPIETEKSSRETEDESAPGDASGGSEADEQKRISMEKDVQQTALNGAQSQALQSVVEGVAGGAFPKETGKEMIKLAFPMADDDQVNGIFDPIEVRERASDETSEEEKSEK